MANRRVDPENKRIPTMITIQKNIKDKIKSKAEINEMSLSEYLEKIIIKNLEQ